MNDLKPQPDPSLDTRKARLYKAARLAVLGGLLVATPASADVVSGAQLPDGAQKVGDRRYRSPRDYEETLKYYRSVYPPGTFPRRSIVSQPGVKAVHIVNPSGKNFAGLNVYEARNEVRIFIVPLNEVSSTQVPKSSK